MVKKDILVALFLTLISFPNRLFGTSKGLFAFTYDQGRDLLEVSKIIWDHNFTLIGPTTGLAGIFYGPWWYYFLVPIFILSNGDPQKIAYIFALIGILSLILLFFFLKRITENFLLAFSLAIIACISNTWMFGPIALWSPTLTPALLLGFFYSAYCLFKAKTAKHFFLLGIFAALVLDTSAAFGVFLIAYLFLQPLIFRKIFLDKRFTLTILGVLLVALPRIVFELKNNFLMTRSALSFISNPKVFGVQLTFVQRLQERAKSFIEIAESAFTNNNKMFLVIEVLAIVIFVFIILKRKKAGTQLSNDSFLKFAISLVVCLFAFSAIYPDTVWDYYLVGLPTAIILIAAIILNYAWAIKPMQTAVILFLLFVISINFDKSLLPPYRATWQGDGSTYNNPKAVVNYLVKERPSVYSLHSYTPARFDYPIDYLISLNVKKGLIKPPEDNKKTMYLIIRDAENKEYLKTGWYGDKTKDKTTIESTKTFEGFLVEKHIRHE